MLPVHDRMPLCLPEACLQDWLSDAVAAQDIMKQPGAPLKRKKPLEQASLFS